MPLCRTATKISVENEKIPLQTGNKKKQTGVCNCMLKKGQNSRKTLQGGIPHETLAFPAPVRRIRREPVPVCDGGGRDRRRPAETSDGTGQDHPGPGHGPFYRFLRRPVGTGTGEHLESELVRRRREPERGGPGGRHSGQLLVQRRGRNLLLLPEPSRLPPHGSRRGESRRRVLSGKGTG